MIKRPSKMRIFVNYCLFALYFSLFANIFAKEPGTVGGQVLKLGGNSRAIGQGEAFVAVSDDVSAIYWNPAGLTQLKNSEIALTHMNRIVDIRSYDIAYAYPTNIGTFGCGIYILEAGDKIRDETTGNELGHFMNYNTYLVLGYARKVAENLSFGANIKVIYNKLHDFESSNSCVDIATLYSPTDRLKFGLNIQNIETRLKFTDETETLPLNIKAGVSYKLLNPHLTVAFDINKAIDSRPNFNIGAEYLISPKFIENIILRAGYKYKPENRILGGLCGASVGLGIKYKKYQIDYAFTPYGALGNTCHRFSFLMRF